MGAMNSPTPHVWMHLVVWVLLLLLSMSIQTVFTESIDTWISPDAGSTRVIAHWIFTLCIAILIVILYRYTTAAQSLHSLTYFDPSIAHKAEPTHKPPTHKPKDDKSKDPDNTTATSYRPDLYG